MSLRTNKFFFCFVFQFSNKFFLYTIFQFNWIIIYINIKNCLHFYITLCWIISKNCDYFPYSKAKWLIKYHFIIWINSLAGLCILELIKNWMISLIHFNSIFLKNIVRIPLISLKLFLRNCFTYEILNKDILNRDI